MRVEDTDEEPKCVICGSSDDCGHMVACIDHTYLDCDGGALYERTWDFRSEIETAFLDALKSGQEKNWQNSDLEQMWDWARENFDINDE